MSDFEETWNADMRAALSGLLVEESLFFALNDSVLNTNAKYGYWTDDEKRHRVKKAFAYADLCAEERYRNWRLEGLLSLRGQPINVDLIARFGRWFTEFTVGTRCGHSTNLVALGLYVNVGEYMLRKGQDKLSFLSGLSEEIGNDLHRKRRKGTL